MGWLARCLEDFIEYLITWQWISAYWRRYFKPHDDQPATRCDVEDPSPPLPPVSTSETVVLKRPGMLAAVWTLLVMMMATTAILRSNKRRYRLDDPALLQGGDGTLPLDANTLAMLVTGLASVLMVVAATIRPKAMRQQQAPLLSQRAPSEPQLPASEVKTLPDALKQLVESDNLNALTKTFAPLALAENSDRLDRLGFSFIKEKRVIEDKKHAETTPEDQHAVRVILAARRRWSAVLLNAELSTSSFDNDQQAIQRFRSDCERNVATKALSVDHAFFKRIVADSFFLRNVFKDGELGIGFYVRWGAVIDPEDLTEYQTVVSMVENIPQWLKGPVLSAIECLARTNGFALKKVKKTCVHDFLLRRDEIQAAKEEHEPAKAYIDAYVDALAELVIATGDPKRALHEWLADLAKDQSFSEGQRAGFLALSNQLNAEDCDIARLLGISPDRYQAIQDDLTKQFKAAPPTAAAKPDRVSKLPDQPPPAVVTPPLSPRGLGGHRSTLLPAPREEATRLARVGSDQHVVRLGP